MKDIFCFSCGKNIKSNWGHILFPVEMYLCYKHNQQYKKYGAFLDNNPKTHKELNEIIIFDDHAEVILYDKYNNEKARVLIDLIDVIKIKNINWKLVGNGYAEGKINKKAIKMHRFLLDVLDKKDVEVDHIDRNRLNNKRQNLRICTRLQNSKNISIRKDNTSGQSGVCWDKRMKKWVVRIQKNKIEYVLGYFSNKEDAMRIRLEAELKYYGEFSPAFKHL